VKRTGRGKSVGAVIHICMGTTQGNSLCSYLYLKLAKSHAFHFTCYVYVCTYNLSINLEEVLRIIELRWEH
jgi:hypothetical protein